MDSRQVQQGGGSAPRRTRVKTLDVVMEACDEEVRRTLAIPPVKSITELVRLPQSTVGYHMTRHRQEIFQLLEKYRGNGLCN